MKKRITIQITKEQKERLKEEARLQLCSQSRIAQLALVNYFKGVKNYE